MDTSRKVRARDKVVVIGGGVMGVGIAQLALLHGHRVAIVEDGRMGEEIIREKILTTMAGYLDKMVGKGKLSAEAKADCLSRLEIRFQMGEMQESALIIEAVTEDLSLKQSLLREAEKGAGPDTLIASNTSTFSITSLAAGLKAPERLVGIHFFNPPVLMSLVEVVRGLITSPEIVERACTWVKNWGKMPVVSSSSPGFIVNRIARPYYCEALSLLDEGVGSPAALDALLVGSGIFPIGVFALIDLIGMDTNYRNTEEMFKAFHYRKRFQPSFTQREYVSAGHLGRKSGQGFYRYGGDGDIPDPGFYPAPPDNEPRWLKKLQVTVQGSDRILQAIGKKLQQKKAAVTYSKTRGDTEIIFRYAISSKRSLQIGILPSDGGYIPSGKHAQVMLDLIPDFDTMSAVAVCAGPGKELSQEEKDLLAKVFDLLGKRILFIPPTCGMVVQRIAAVVIDEALQALGEGVCREEEVDVALAAGMNWKRQPMELLHSLSPGYIRGVLDRLYQTTGNEKYRPSLSLLRRCL